MKILLVASEALPYCKSGGLGDFIFSYGKALAKLGEDVSVILPLYKSIRIKHPEVRNGFYDQFDFKRNWRTQGCGVFKVENEGVKFYFTARDRFDRDNRYGYGDDTERFACFRMAVNTFITRHNDFDVVHCNDWQTGVLPLLLSYNKKKIKTFLTIHNPAYQGWAKREDLSNFFNLDLGYYDSGYCRLGDSFNYLKTGIRSADKINTVSKTHAQELIHDHNSFGGLGAIIDWCRHYDFSGIVNGLDVDIWNPQTDSILARNYNVDNYAAGKAANKQEILHRLNWQEGFTGPLFSAITRLSSQKGVERILDLFPHLRNYGARRIIIGTGEREDQVLAKALSTPEVYLVKRYDENLAHLLYAASDFFLRPSHFEPCGTSQMISSRYGTLPIVSNVGGLNDTVVDIQDGPRATGFVFHNDDYFGLVNAFYNACNLYHAHNLDSRIRRGMGIDFSWKKSAEESLKLYHSVDWK